MEKLECVSLGEEASRSALLMVTHFAETGTQHLCFWAGPSFSLVVHVLLNSTAPLRRGLDARGRGDSSRLTFV